MRYWNRSGLSDRANQRVKTYSGGIKRRVNIGVGLLHRPRLLFMDEPTVGIDPQSRRAILDFGQGLNRQGMTVLYTTHYMEEAQELSDRVGIIDHGELIALGTQANYPPGGSKRNACFAPCRRRGSTPLSGCTARDGGSAGSRCQRHSVTVMVPEAEEFLAPAITRANELGVKIRSVDMHEPNLEAVFLHLTGRALRD